MRLKRRQTVLRALNTLALRAQGYSQAATAREVGVSVRRVKSYEALARGGWIPTTSALEAAILEAYHRERSSLARSQLLASYARLAIARAKRLAEKARLREFRRISPVVLAAAEEDTTSRTSAPAAQPSVETDVAELSPQDLAHKLAAVFADAGVDLAAVLAAYRAPSSA